MKGFYISMKLSKLNLIYVLTILVALVTFFYFRWANQQSEYRTQQVINSLLRNESLIANTYALSKSILDLEKLEIIRCSELIEDFSEKRVFYSTVNQNHCYQSVLMKAFNEFSFDSKAVNGLKYRITLQLNMPWQSIILETLIYLILALGANQLNKYLNKQEEISLVRIKASEIEKQMFFDKTLQIRHDVASPIATMKLFLEILRDVDPKIKEMFARSLDRTQELFNQLNADNENTLSPCLIGRIVQGIVTEKEIDKKNGVTFKFDSGVDNDFYVLANKVELERIVSNILNNAIEACQSSLVKKIQVSLVSNNNMIELKITDTGKGIPRALFNKLGAKGFSYGKENLQTSGSGLGLHHAMTTIKSWKGSFIIESDEGIGTTITLHIPSAAT